MSEHTIVLSMSLRLFKYSFAVCSCHLFCVCQVLGVYVLLCPTLHEMSPWVSLIFLKRSLVCPLLLFSSISHHCSLKKAFVSLFAILDLCIQLCIPFPFSFAFCFPSFSAVCKAFSDSSLPSCISFLGDGFGHHLLYMLRTSSHGSSGTLSFRSNPLNLSSPPL